MNFSRKTFALLLLVAFLSAGFCAYAENPAYPESSDGLKKLTEDLMAAIKDGKKDVATGIIKEFALPKHEEWFTKVFGADAAKKLSAEYVDALKTMEADIYKLFEGCIAKGQFDVTAYKLEKADDPLATGAQKKAMTEMKEKPALYGVKMVEPKKDHGMHLWSFVFVDGKFRLVGKLKL